MTLVVEGLRGGYLRSVDVIHDVRLDVPNGTAVGLVGRNGAGKSCLAGLLMGVRHRSGGDITLGGSAIGSLTPAERIRAGLSLVPEGRLVFQQLTVRENLVVAAYGAGRRIGSAELTAIEDRFEVLARKAGMRAGSMSGGEQQILAIARALVQRPSVIVLDEPSLGLAPVMVNAVRDVLAEVLADGVAILLMEQNRHLVRELCSLVHVVQGGRLAVTGPPDEILSDEAVAGAYMSE